MKPTCRKSWAGNLLMWPLIQGQTRTAKHKSAYNSFVIDPIGSPCGTNLQDIMGWESSDVRFDLLPLL